MKIVTLLIIFLCVLSVVYKLYNANNSLNIDYVSYNWLTKDYFVNNYEKASKPCILLNAMDDWKAKDTWNPSHFGKHCKRLEFLAGYYNTPKKDRTNIIDEHDRTKVSYDYFFKHAIRDRSKNLYIFDPDFGERELAKQLLEDYKILDIFQDNVFAEKIPDVDERPPYRWVLIGTTGSGGGLHIDPLGTSAWNALFHGKKLWFLFPPGTPVSQNENNQGEKWLKYEYPKIKHYKHIKLVQNPGEIIFVPAGWWHIAINVGVTFAVTQNYLHPHNIDFGLREVRKHRPDLVKYINATEQPAMY